MHPAAEIYAENLALKAELANLQAQVAWFQRQMFGTRSEKLPVCQHRSETHLLPAV